MVSRRARESEKQAHCREQNESVSENPTTAHASEGGSSYRCECSDRRCSRAITMTPAEYAVVRAYATHFAIARDHENPESEQVLEENGRFAVVKTVTGDEVRLARRSDPRQRHREERWS